MQTSNILYHIHRKGNVDLVWNTGNKVIVDDNFTALYYVLLLHNEKILIKKYTENYDIDYVITNLKKFENTFLESELKNDYYNLLKMCYFLRREKALEKGRKIFNPNAPCRYKSIFLTNEYNLNYWENMVGNNNYSLHLLELQGNIFQSSDLYFPNENKKLIDQVEDSKTYWNPNISKETTHTEYLFQGVANIIK